MGEDWLAVVNDSFDRRVTTNEMREGCPHPTAKKKGDPMELKNWRPVALMCTDYKIVTKVLSTRLREVMGQIIRTSPAVFPAGQIGDNIYPDSGFFWTSLGLLVWMLVSF